MIKNIIIIFTSTLTLFIYSKIVSAQGVGEIYSRVVGQGGPQNALSLHLEYVAAQQQLQAQRQFELQKMLLQHKLEMEEIQAEATATQQSQATNINPDEKIFSGRVYQNIESANKEYDDFIKGRQYFIGKMFSLYEVQQDTPMLVPLLNSLNVNQMTTIFQGGDGQYYVIMRIQ